MRLVSLSIITVVLSQEYDVLFFGAEEMGVAPTKPRAGLAAFKAVELADCSSPPLSRIAAPHTKLACD
jgi:hypothetical protein